MRLARLVWRSVILIASALAMVLIGVHGLLGPDLVLLVIATIALVSGPLWGAVWGLTAGWLVDLTPPGAAVLGISALLYATAAALIGRARRDDGVPLLLLLLVLTGGELVVLCGRILLALANGAPIALPSLGIRLLMTIALGGLLVPLLVRLDRRIAPRRV